MKKCFIAFVLLGAVACGSPSTDQENNFISVPSENPQIFGGQLVEANPLQKSVVAIYSTKERGGHLCTGTLISEKVILTAAHCIEDDISKIRVIFGRSLLDTKKITRTVEAGFRHPDYDGRLQRDQKDIGLLILNGDLPQGYLPSQILLDARRLKADVSVQVLGYGISWPLPGREADKKGAGLLREVDLKIDDPRFSRTEISLVQGPLRGGMCNGDSGGPAFAVIEGKKYLWGVGSRARGALFASCILDSVYTRVDMYTTWIDETLRTYGSKHNFERNSESK